MITTYWCDPEKITRYQMTTMPGIFTAKNFTEFSYRYIFPSILHAVNWFVNLYFHSSIILKKLVELFIIFENFIKALLLIRLKSISQFLLSFRESIIKLNSFKLFLSVDPFQVISEPLASSFSRAFQRLSESVERSNGCMFECVYVWFSRFLIILLRPIKEISLL